MTWCALPGPGPSGGLGWLSAWLWAQGVLRQPACWWGRCISAQLDAWPEASQFCRGSGPGAKVGRLTTPLVRTCVHSVTCASPPMAVPVSVSPGGGAHGLLPLREALQDQQVGLTQAPFKLLLLPWISEHVRFCVRPLRVESLFPTAPRSRENKPHWPSKLSVLGAYLPGAGPLDCGT